MNGITSAELARRAHVVRGAITQARDRGRIFQDEDGTFDPDDPDVALYIQRGIERDERRRMTQATLPPPPFVPEEPERSEDDVPEEIEEPEPPETPAIPDPSPAPAPTESNETRFVSAVISVLDSEVGKKKERDIMQKILTRYKEAQS